MRQSLLSLHRSFYAERGLAGLDDAARKGRPPSTRDVTRYEIIARTLVEPPAELGITH